MDPRLIPDTAAHYASDVWLYSGAPEGLPTPKLLHTCTLSNVGKVFRLPASYTASSYLYGSTWMEFQNPNTDVVRASVFGDDFDRYYWVSPSETPKYNPRARINSGLPGWLLGIPDPLQPGLTVVDTVPPVLQSATVPADIPTTIVLVFNEELNSTFVPSTTAWTASGKTVNAVAVSEDTVTLTVNAAYVFGDQPTVTYTLPGTNGLRDASGNLVASFSVTMVQNASGSDNIASKIPSGVTTTKVVVSRAYVTTYVSAYGEEGPPSPAALASGNQDAIWRLTLPAPDPLDLGTNRNLTRVRIYRTITTTNNIASFFLVTELAIGATTYDDTTLDTAISGNNELPSVGWTAPPTDLQGFITMPNGIVAGWRDNEVWFSEPFRPHAWPAAYVQTTEYPIVGLGVTGQSLVAATQGFPVVISGVTPSGMSAITLVQSEPCLSRQSIMSSPEGVYYASPNGLMMVVAGAATNITRELVTKDEWQQLTRLTALSCARFGMAYYAFGTVRLGVFEPTAFQTNAFAQQDFSGAFLGVMIDPVNIKVGFSMLSSDIATAGVQNDIWSGELLTIRNNAVYWLDQADSTNTKEPFYWKSKIFQTPDQKNIGATQIYFEKRPEVTEPGPYGTFKLYADGRLVMTKDILTSGQIMRPPSGFKADFWQFDITARMKVLSVYMATSVKELKAV